MPKVPTYDQFTIQPSDAAMPRFNAPDMPIVAGKEAAAVGEGMIKVGTALSAAAEKAAQDANQIRVIDATNEAVKAQMYLTYDQKDGFLNFKGKAALERPDNKPLDVEYTERLQGQLEAIENKLGNNDQKRMFKQVSAQITRQFMGNVNQHVAAEFKDYQTGTLNGSIDVATQKMTLSFGEPAVVAEQQRVIAAAVAERDKSLPEEQRQANLIKALSPGNSAVVSAAVDAGNTLYAREFLKQNAEFITPENRLVLAKAVELGGFEERTQNYADQYIKEAKGDYKAAIELARTKLSGKDEDRTVERIKGRAEEGKQIDAKQVQSEAERIITANPKDVSAQLAAARKELEGDLENQVIAKISAMDAETTAIRERKQKAAKELGYAEYNKTGSFAKIPKSILAEMDPNDVTNLREFAQNRIYNQTVRGQAAEERRERELYRKAAPEYLALANDPDKLERMSTTDIIAMQGKLGLQHTEALLKRREQLQNREGKLTAKMDNDQFNAIANEYGLNPFAKSKSKSDKEVLGLVKSRVDMMLEDAVKRKRAPLTKDEKADIMRDAFKQDVEIDGLFWNSTKPAITMTPKDAEKVVVPKGDRVQILEALKAGYKKYKTKEYEPTEENIRRMYIQGLQK